MKKIGIAIGSVMLLLILFVFTSEKEEVFVKLSFPGMEKGLYPNGEVFEVRDILDDNLLWEVYQRKDLNYSFEEFKNSLYIREINGEFDKTLDNIKKNNQETYGEGSFVLKSNLPLFKEEKVHEMILDEFVNKKLTSKIKWKKLGSTTKAVFEDYFDFEAKIFYLRRKNLNLINFLENKVNEVNLHERGNYENMLLDQKLFESIELLKLENRIKNTKIVKRKDTVTTIKIEKIKELEIKRKKHQGELGILLELVKEYKPENSQLIITSNSKDNKYNFGSERKYYTDMIERITDTNVEIARITEEIKYLQEEIKLIKEDVKETEYIVKELETLKESFNKRIDEINIFIEGENKRYYSNILEVGGVEVVRDRNYLKIFVITILSAFVYLVIMYSIKIIKKFKEKEISFV